MTGQSDGARCPRCEGYEATYHTFEGECSQRRQPDRARLRELLEEEILQAVQEESGIDHVAARELYAAFNAVRGERDAALDRLDEVEAENERLRRYEAILYPPEEEP